MGEVFKNVLVLSLTGTAVSVVLMMIKPFTRQVFSPVWQYYIWIVALIAYIVPVSFNVNIIGNEVNGFDMPVIEYENTGNVQVISENTERYTADNEETDVINVNADYVGVLVLCWLVAALGIFIYRIIQYNIFLKTLKRYSEDHINIDNIPVGLKTKKTTLVDAPLVIGLFKPVLYIPDTEISCEVLKYIINHEFTHYRRGDIIYKWFAMVVSCVHWFNPVIYLLLKNIDEDCEISCDYIVTRNMSESERTGYMNTILELICRSVKNKSMLSTQMAGSKKMLKRRFDVIKKGRKYKLYVSVISIAAAILLISAYAFAGSGINNQILDNSNAVLSNEDYSVKNILVMCDDDRGRINIAILLSFDKGSGILNMIPIETSLILDNSKNINEFVSERGDDEGVSAIENALSSDIDNYIKINSAAIGEIANCLGGISVDIEEGMYYSAPGAGVDFHIDEGMQVLSGEEISALLLYRGNTDGEITKCGLQGKIVSEIIRQMYNKENRDKLNETEKIINRNTEKTDFEEGVIDGIKSVFNRSISSIRVTELSVKNYDSQVQGLEIDKEKLGSVLSIIEFVPDKELEKYVDTDSVLKTMKSEPFGATGPQIAYANEKYAVIKNYNGMVIYSLTDEKFCGGIDSRALGMNKMQGDEITLVKAYGEYIFIYNSGDETRGYIYSVKSNKIMKAENIDSTAFNENQPYAIATISDNSGSVGVNECHIGGDNIVKLVYGFDNSLDIRYLGYGKEEKLSE